MRILTFGLKSDLVGGIEAFALLMARHTYDLGLRFDHVFLEKDSLIHGPAIEATGGRIFMLPYYVRHPLGYLFGLCRLLRRRRVEVAAVYVHLFSLVHILPVIVARMMGMKVIVHAHNNDIQHRSAVYRLLNAAGKLLLSHCRCLRLSNSDASTRFMLGSHHLDDTHIIYNAIEVERFAFDPAARRQLRRDWQAEGQTVVGYVGRLALQKNPLFALDVFSAFHARQPQSLLVMVGEGPLEPDVRRRITSLGLTDAVRLMGARNDVARLYQAMDVLLTPSLFEGLGIVLVEAQAAGLPCLTTAETVPTLVDLTPLIARTSLHADAATWADHLTDLAATDHGPRAPYAEAVAQTRFHIQTEARRFAAILQAYAEEPADRH